MFFAGLFAMYFTLRSTNPEVWAEQTEFLNIPFATANTLVLVSSSVTCQLGVLAAERGDVKGMRRWYTITSTSASGTSAMNTTTRMSAKRYAWYSGELHDIVAQQ